mgnify:CR=1 FL=1
MRKGNRDNEEVALYREVLESFNYSQSKLHALKREIFNCI